MEDLYQITNIFAIISGLLVAALGAAETQNDKLKVALSIGGILIAGLWVYSAWYLPAQIDRLRLVLRYFLPGIFLVAWLVSFFIHLSRLKK